MADSGKMDEPDNMNNHCSSTSAKCEILNDSGNDHDISPSVIEGSTLEGSSKASGNCVPEESGSQVGTSDSGQKHNQEMAEDGEKNESHADTSNCTSMNMEESTVETASEQNSLSLGTMKKDDSGISFGKSPVKDEACMMLDDTESASCSRAAASKDSDDGKLKTESRGSRPSTSTVESEGVVADFVDTEELSEQGGDQDEQMKVSKDTPQDMSDDDSDDEDISNDREEEEGPINLRKRRNRRISTSSDDEDDTRETNDTKSVKSTDSEPEETAEDVVMPTDKWRPLLELRKREYGLSNRIPYPQLFETQTMGSLNLVKRLKCEAKLDHHEGCVNALHFNKAGTLLASGSDDLSIVIWKWMEKQTYLVFDTGHRSNVFQSKFMPYTGDCHLVSCARDGQVRLAQLSSIGECRATKKLAQHKGAAHKLALLSDSPHVFYSCGEDAVTYEMDLRQDKPNRLCTTKDGDKKVALYSIHANPFKSEEFCVGGRDHYIRVYDKRMIQEDEACLKKYCPHHLISSDVKANVTCAVYNYNGTEILGTYNDEDIFLFDNRHSDGAEYTHKYRGHRNNATVKGVNFYGPKSEYIVSGSDCSNVFLWEKETEQIVQYFHADEGGVVNVLEPHPCFPVLATSGLDHDVKIWVPSADDATDLDGLKTLTKQNRKQRAQERINEPDMMDGQMLWLLMQHLRRSARRRARTDGEDISLSSSSNSSDSEPSDEDPSEPLQCAPS